jgi:hypothetical protein
MYSRILLYKIPVNYSTYTYEYLTYIFNLSRYFYLILLPENLNWLNYYISLLPYTDFHSVTSVFYYVPWPLLER